MFLLNKPGIECIFDNTLKSDINPMCGNGTKCNHNSHREVGVDIIDIDYVFNNYGYRGKDFIPGNPADILILGCSITMGSGLPIEKTWGHILSSEIGGGYDNLAIPGSSAMYQIKKCFSYFNEIGIPKVIFANFPMFRYYIPVVRDVSITQTAAGHSDFFFNKDKDVLMSPVVISEETLAKYSKAPHKAEEVTSVEQALYFSFSHIFMLEQYCKSMKIPFFWGTWETNAESNVFLKEKIKGNFNNFIDLEDDTHKCHLHTKDSNHLLFHTAADRKDGHPHPGFHIHLHYAEKFLNEYNLKVNI